MLGDVNKLFVFKSLLTTSSNVLPWHLKQTFPPIIWIFTEGVGDGIKSRLPFKIFSTLRKTKDGFFHIQINHLVTRLNGSIGMEDGWNYKTETLLQTALFLVSCNKKHATEMKTYIKLYDLIGSMSPYTGLLVITP